MWLLSKRLTVADCGILRGFTDYHSHILPGVDDGSSDMDESLSILSQMEESGVASVWLTPHIMDDIPNETNMLKEKFTALSAIYTGTIHLHLAAEYMLDSLFDERLVSDDILPLTADKHYLLVETSTFSSPVDMSEKLSFIKSRGYVPLLAHPERYEYMQMSHYFSLKSQNISFQLNLSSLAGMYGDRVRIRAEKLLKLGLYDKIGSDTHSLGYFNRLKGSYLRHNKLFL